MDPEVPIAPGKGLKNHSGLTDKLRELLSKRNDEQAELQELNGRFASYIAKIRSLEQQNQTLEVELKQLQSHESKRVAELYEEKISNLRMQMETQNLQSSRLEIELEDMKDRLQKAIDEKEEALNKLNSLKEDLDAPTLASKVLEGKIKFLQDEIAFQKKIHGEEIQELQIRFKETKSNVQTDGANSDLTAVLQELQTQFQKTADTKSSETEEWYKSKMLEMDETANKNNETLKKLRQEITELRNQNQKNQREISFLKTTNEDLKSQITEMEEYYLRETQTLQETITELEAEKNEMKDNMVQLHEYQDLLKVKMALDLEIRTYRELLEKEERRLKPSEPSNGPLSDEGNCCSC
ncbi:desmin-like [Poecilia reticulata]|nr:PREDICTED: desmin-like [Poecilia reticulata]